ncbi:MAG TPA: hypothetical protein VGH71_01625 [Gammaproteobacteria bacterium]|jgi:hypothetical protein
MASWAKLPWPWTVSYSNWLAPVSTEQAFTRCPSPAGATPTTQEIAQGGMGNCAACKEKP